MTLAEAMAESGLSAYTLKVEARKGSFEADLPRGRRGGYVFDEATFRHWLIRRRLKTGNPISRARARRQLEAFTWGTP
ncbi:MAG: hypothetical protein IAE97_10500 [Chthoniobacterales bacterium]|nr:hypothetical protein [Chthoniobacterales bacterium]